MFPKIQKCSPRIIAVLVRILKSVYNYTRLSLRRRIRQLLLKVYLTVWCLKPGAEIFAPAKTLYDFIQRDNEEKSHS